MCQSSNDVIPSAMHVSAVLASRRRLLPALETLRDTMARKERAWSAILKTGRTHLMDATPMTLGQEVSGWRAQIENAIDRLGASEPRLLALAQGGTAIGTGINAHEEFAARFIEELRALTSLPFETAPNFFAAMGTQDAAVEFSGQLRTLAVSLIKIANDLRWMGSGPLAGLAELKLPALQPGSSIMPGKVNPVIPEAVAMVATHVVGPRRIDRARRAIRQFPAQRHVAADRQQPADEHRAARERGARAGRALHRRRRTESRAARRNAGAQSHPRDRAQSRSSATSAPRRSPSARTRKDGRCSTLRCEMSGLSEDELTRLLDPAALTHGGLHGGGGSG